MQWGGCSNSAVQQQLVSWNLTSLFSAHMAISETKGQGWRVILTQWRNANDTLTSTQAMQKRVRWTFFGYVAASRKRVCLQASDTTVSGNLFPLDATAPASSSTADAVRRFSVTYTTFLSLLTAQLVIKLEHGPMPNVMVALPNIGGARCSMPQCLANAHYQSDVH